MFKRPFWEKKVSEAWGTRSLVWLTGVRRVGKTTLARSLEDGTGAGALYLDCELPSARREIDDPEAFLRSVRGRTVVLDEVHRLSDPAALLKIAADHFPDVRILAAGSSTLGASSKFKDTLTGRKVEVWLTPLVQADAEPFGSRGLEHRLLRGGLPPFHEAAVFPERDFQEWTDAYWARDIQELFRLERRHAFQRLFELVLASSGGIFEATRFARACEVSRQTIHNYLGVLEATFVAHLVRPWSRNANVELVSAPRVYGFDTGFVAYHKGWTSLRPEDRGVLWEHLVLNELHAHRQSRDIYYWRTKQGHEVDFVLGGRGDRPPVAIECKWSAADFDARNLATFRKLHPGGLNYVVVPEPVTVDTRVHGELEVRYVTLKDLANIARVPDQGRVVSETWLSWAR
ncbi:MAG: ATP-binding protein [Gemmatimonadetes bacterium]|nr:ATP-binding protein [Gemmatimonadota bacterium]